MKLSQDPSTIKFLNELNSPDSSLENIISSNVFPNLWLSADQTLYSFIIKHYEELIEIGFQIKKESIYSIRCLQIISSFNQNFRNRLFAETKILQFVYDYIFNISTYPIYSQKSYFYVLPNIMLDQLYRLNPIFDAKYFIELFNHSDNNFAYNFILRMINLAPFSITKALKKFELGKIILSNLITGNQKDKEQSASKLLINRNQTIFKHLINAKLVGNLSEVLCEKIDSIIQSAIQNPNSETFSLIQYIDEFSMSKFTLSKWKKVHLKMVPYLSTFCMLLTNSNSKSFTSLSQSLTMLSINIISTTKNVTNDFVNLFKFLMNLFFELKTNTFLHNCCLKAFNLLLSLEKVNSNFLDEMNLFTKVTVCYEKSDTDYMNSFMGQIRLISEGMNQFVINSKTVDIEKWNKYVLKKNQIYDEIVDKKYGGPIPFNLNSVKLPFWEFLNSPSFLSKNLFITDTAPRKNSSPLS